MAFMEKQITSKRTWWEVEGTHGSEWYDAEDFTELEARQNYPGHVTSSTPCEGYGARLSAPGYLDCTEWAVFESVDKANEYLNDMFGEDEDGESKEDSEG